MMSCGMEASFDAMQALRILIKLEDTPDADTCYLRGLVVADVKRQLNAPPAAAEVVEAGAEDADEAVEAVAQEEEAAPEEAAAEHEAAEEEVIEAAAEDVDEDEAEEEPEAAAEAAEEAIDAAPEETAETDDAAGQEEEAAEPEVKKPAKAKAKG
jgi:hypothetical protein